MAQLAYTTLFLGLPVVGVLCFQDLCRRMADEHIAEAPVLPLFFIFAAYGALLLFAVSAAFRVWSGTHTIAFVGLFFVGIPWFLVQGRNLRRAPQQSPYHRAAATLSLYFPAAFAAFLVFSFIVGA